MHTTTRADLDREIETIRRTIGIHPATGTLNDIAKRYGAATTEKKGARLLRAFNSGDRAKFYPEMNANLDAVRFTADLHPAAAVWPAELIERGVREGTAIDIGCGTGVGTCTLAALLPDLQIHGIDQDQYAVNRGREIADILGLSNVTFHTVDEAADLPPAELLLSSMVVHEMADLDTIAETLWYDDNDSRYTQLETEALGRVAHTYAALLAPGGKLYSVERFAYLDTWARWVDALAAAGVQVNIDECAHTEWTTHFGTENFPVTVAEKTTGRTAVDTSMLETLWAPGCCC